MQAILLAATLAAFLSTPGAAPGTSETGPVRVAVTMEHDQRAHGAFLDELAQHRRSGDHASFRARLDAERARQAERRAPTVARFEALGLSVVDELWLTESFLVEAPHAAAVEALAALPGVLAVSRPSLRLPATLKAALNANHHDTAGANQIVFGATTVEGDGVVVALIDTGIDADMGGTGVPHKAFYEDADLGNDSGGIAGSRVLSAEAQINFQTPEDHHGHGTRVASVIAGAKYNNVTGVSDGAAPRALLRSIRIDVDDPLGLASTWTMADAFEAAAAMPDVRVANMSYDGTLDPVEKPNLEIDAAARAGLVVTLSAGNDGGAAFFHGAYNALAVGASDLQTKEPYSNGAIFVSAFGPLPDGRRYPRLIAVGEDLTSAVIDDEASAAASYGTSGSAGIVAGTAALVLQVAPGLTAREVRALLLNTSLAVTLGKEAARGFGYLHGKNAVEAALDGLTVPGFGLPGTRTSYRVTLAGGEELVATLAWDRVIDVPADLDLRLVSPDGLLIAESIHGFDTVEHLRAVAPTAGDYTLEVDVRNAEPGEFSVGYGLAASVPAVVTGLTPLCSGQLPVADVVQDGLVDVPTPSFQAEVAIKGCALGGATAVRVAGLPADFSVLGDTLLRAQLPLGVGAGSQPVEVDTPGGTLTSGVALGVAPPTLVSSYVIGATHHADALTIRMQGGPGETYVALYSFTQVPSSFPGLVDFDIGAGGFDLWLLYGPGVLDADGTDFQDLGLWPTADPPTGLKVYQQAVVFSSGPGGGLVPSNVDSSLVIF